MDSNKMLQTLHADAIVPLHRHLQTLWSEFTHRIPKFKHGNINNPFSSLSSSSSSFRKKTQNRSLTSREISTRMLDIPVYKIDNRGEEERRGISELYCFSKLYAHAIHDDDSTIYYNPLANVVEFEGRAPPVSLVPELSQVKNAIELRNKDRKEDATPDLSFRGVPVFQSDRLAINIEGKDENYTPAFFRKEELEKHIQKDRDIIKVSSFEDIIRKMKDNSTSESNDILFVGPEELFSIGTMSDGQLKYKMNNHFPRMGITRDGSIYTIPAKNTVQKTLKLRSPAN